MSSEPERKVDLAKRPRIPAVERRGLVIHVDGQPTIQLNMPNATRPVDWAEPARSWIFTEAEIARDLERRARHRDRA